MSNFGILKILRNIYFDFFSTYKTETANRTEKAADLGHVITNIDSLLTCRRKNDTR